MNRKAFRAAVTAAAFLLAGGAVSTPFPESSFAVVAEAASVRPAAPSNVYYAERTSDSVTLTWDSVKGADAYRVYRFDKKTKKYVSCKTVKETSYTVEGLRSDTEYKFKVAALKRSDGKYTAGKASETVAVSTVRKFRAGRTVSCPMFSMTLPSDVDYVIETGEDHISVYDKEAKEGGFGGWVFTVTAYDEPFDYSGVQERKVGELRTSDGNVCDVTVTFAVDIRYDEEKYSDIPENYSKLFDSTYDILKTVSGKNGSKFTFGGGVK